SEGGWEHRCAFRPNPADVQRERPGAGELHSRTAQVSLRNAGGFGAAAGVVSGTKSQRPRPKNGESRACPAHYKPEERVPAMPDSETILIRDLPNSFNHEVQRAIVHYTIAFVRDPESVATARLAGSGVLVRVGETRAILTADHVIENLPRRGKVGLFLRRT